ncbi:AMP-binding protein [Streptomyces sp. NPDC055243]|uniref:AMP-binding protein n=1 Tax=Streptomyces sp. NPDC055243 TaxID=3365720 RepID=UPI0037D78AC9
MSNLATALSRAAERYPQQPAVWVDENVLTYAELDELSARVAGGLLAHGVRHGDRVGMRLPDLPAFPVLYFGALRAGAIVMPVYSPSSALAVRPCSAAYGARLVFSSHHTNRTREAEVCDATHVTVGPDFLGQVAFWPQHSGVVHRSDSDPAVMTCSRDAAGSPQITALTHGALRVNAVATAPARFYEGAGANALGDLPAFSFAGLTHCLKAVILAGTCLHVGPASVPSTPVNERQTAVDSPAPRHGAGPAYALAGEAARSTRAVTHLVDGSRHGNTVGGNV